MECKHEYSFGEVQYKGVESGKGQSEYETKQKNENIFRRLKLGIK